MQSRIQSSAGKSNNPINTTLVAKKNTAQPVKNISKSQSLDPKFNCNLLNNISPSFTRRSSPKPLKINPKLGNENSFNQSERETESEKSETTIQRFAALNKKLTARPKLKHSFNTIPVQPRLKVSIPPGNRLQQKITEKQEAEPTEKLSTKTITSSSSTPPDKPGSDNSDSVINRSSKLGHSLGNFALSAPRTTSPSPLVQTKLTISTPGDKQEQEADTVAAKVVERINQPNFAAEAKAKSIARNTIRSQHLARRQSPLPINPSKSKRLVHLSPQSKRMTAVTIQAPRLSFHNNLEASIQRARGGGQPLGNKVREPMEQALGADFSEVKIHTDSQADQLNNAIQARAFTTGQDIFFRQGEYNPENREGQGLLAHELTHVVQQTGGQKVQKAQNKLSPHKLTNLVEDNGIVLEPKSINTISAKANKIQFKVAEESSDNVEAKQQEKSDQQNSEIETGKPEENQGEKPGTAESSKEKEPSNKAEAGKKEQKQNPSAKTPAKAQKVTNLEKSRGGSAGKAAVLGKEATDTEAKAEPGAKAPTSPDADPVFQAVVGKAKKVAQQEKQHEPAKTKANQAQAAAVAPPSEVESKGQANQMGEMEQAETPGFDKAAFKAKLMERIT
ncbi:MAG: DUF4157 domain-containing protein, partial [Xenococcaceae cyanobacterium MO_188.B19]|nr:DUF4157 domain-containing protein [Xenococcaceae cyanobacterium MO_188.B19]